jgi:type II secretory pathway predicted ATPase ExeA
MNQNDTSVETGRRLYYSSSQGPFYNANNIFMFYGGGERGDTVESIVRSLRTDDHIMHVHGERGSGKTMLSLVISDRLKHRYNIIRYDVPEISASLLLRHLLIELCPKKADLISAKQAQDGVEQSTVDAALDAVVQQLTQADRQRAVKPFVLIVDSQTEPDPVAMRILDHLAGLRFQDQPIMHCVVFHRVSDEAARSINGLRGAQRPGNHFWLRRLTLAEINEYLRHHMLLFDFNRRDLFTREMAYFIADRSEGVFRSINTLARNAFTIANLEDADKLSMSHLLMAGLPPRAEPLTESRFMVRHRGGMIALLGSCVVASAAVAVFLFM